VAENKDVKKELTPLRLTCVALNYTCKVKLI